MRRLEKLLLSKVEVWIVVVILTMVAAATVAFGAFVKDAVERKARDLDHATALVRGMRRVAEIPETFSLMLFGSPRAIAPSQRFDGQAGMDFAAVHFSEIEGAAGYLLLQRYGPKFHPKLGYQYLNRESISLEIIDLSRRKTIYVWQPDMDRSMPYYLLPDGSLVTWVYKSSPRRKGSYLARQDACSNVVWRNHSLGAHVHYFHHSMEQDADGHFWTLGRVSPTLFGASSRMQDHSLIRFSSSGDVLSRISLSDMLVRNGYRYLLYGAQAYESDPMHVNDVQPVLQDGPFWRRGDLFVNLRTNSVVFLYRPVTDEVVWLQSGPWLHQHDVDIVSEHEISVFSNNSVATGDGDRHVLGANEVYIYDFATGEARSPWREAMQQHEVRTLTKGAATLFDDGSVMVEEHNYGRILLLSADGTVQWSYVNRASDGQVYRLGDSRWLDAEYGAEVVRALTASASVCP